VLVQAGALARILCGRVIAAFGLSPRTVFLRNAELEQLRDALDRASLGHGQVVAVVGEPGVGKLRLFWPASRRCARGPFGTRREWASAVSFTTVSPTFPCMFRAGTERRPQRGPQGFKPRYAVVQPESPSPHRRWAVPGARGRASACIGPHVPDLAGCVAVGETREEVLQLIREAIELHIDGLKEDGLPVPTPSSEGEFVEVGAA